MDTSTEKTDTANIGSLFQQIINDLKNTSPLWDDLVIKANKLHACLKATIQAIVYYLEAFQKIADAATNSKGASKEIGTALTRVCLRHKAVETRLKTFTTAIMDCLIIPLQEKIEDWKKQVAFIDKEHAKEFKRCRLELKKSSTDTLRLQKKAKKGQMTNIQNLVETSMQDYNQRQAELDEIERKSLRTVMIEERMRYCTFVFMLQPVVKEECEVMYELGHLQEVMQSIGNVTKEPHTLPQASEELIQDSKMPLSFYPDSPGGSNSQQNNNACSNSLGSRKSSVCSISSINSNSSGSPGHQFQRSLSQYAPNLRLKPGESKDSGFCSSPAIALQVSSSTVQSHAVSTWPPPMSEPSNDSRPHTISTAYEKGHIRPPLTVYTFQNPDASDSGPPLVKNAQEKGQARPPLPVRCSSLERPLSTVGLRNSPNASKPCPSPIPLHVTKEYTQAQPQPTYVNMTELATMAANKSLNTNNTATSSSVVSSHATNQQQQPNSPVLSTTSSLVSPDSSATNPISLISSPDVSLMGETPQNTPHTSCPQTPIVQDAPGVGNNIGDGDEKETTTTSVSELTLHETHVTTSVSSLTLTDTQDITDSKCTGSVLAKATLFEQLEKKQLQEQAQQVNVVSRTSTGSTNSSTMGESIYGSRKEELYKSTSALENLSELHQENHKNQNYDQIDKETIDELNSLIGELDLFQKEHEMMERKLNEKLGYASSDSPLILMNENNHFLSQPPPSSSSPLQISTTQSTRSFSMLNNDIINNHTHNNSDTSSDRNEKLSEASDSLTNFNIHNGFIVTTDNHHISTKSATATDATKNELIINNASSLSDNNASDSLEGLNTGFENPSFLHLNDTEIVVIRQNAFPSEVDTFNHNVAEVITLKHDSNLKLDEIGNSNENLNARQRLSSFRSVTPPLLLHTASLSSFSSNEFTTFGAQDANNSLSSTTTTTSSKYYTRNHSLVEETKVKPAISPRPASLSGGVSRIARRSSVNTVKPPPPVRRSSSVTPGHNLGSQSPINLSSQNLMTSSSESLPPPPAYLLDKGSQLAVGGNVAGTVRALNEMRHTPASPNVMRRAQQIAQHYQAEQQERQQRQEATIAQHTRQSQSSSPFSPVKYDAPGSTGTFSYHSPPQIQEHQKTKGSGVYAKPQINLGTSSFKQTGHGILSQIAKRINPSKHQQQQQQQQQQQYDSGHNDGLNQRSGNNGEHQEGASRYYDQQQHYTNEDYYHHPSTQHHQAPPSHNYYSTPSHAYDQQDQSGPPLTSSLSHRSTNVPKYASTNPFLTSPPPQVAPRTVTFANPPTTSSSFHGKNQVPSSHQSSSVSRIARRSSVNTVKPPPPVRRSSSVTPGHNLGSQSPINLSSQNLMTSSSESLPPPPAYLLDKGSQLVGGNVAGTVRALNEMRHTPASPNVMRRAQQIAQHYQAEQQERQQRQEATIAQHTRQSQSSSPFSPVKYDAPGSTGTFSYHSPPQTQEHQKTKGSGVYAKPQINLGTSSFKQTGHGILSQIAKRINPSKHQQQQQQQQQQQYDSGHNDGLNQRSGNNGEHQEGASRYYDQQQHYTNEDYMNVDRPTTHTGSVIAKTNAGFLENLNQKLAEQRLSGKAYAVRSYINKNTLRYNQFKPENSSPTFSYSVPIEYEDPLYTNTSNAQNSFVKPDPRMCHESLLDQIKKGATLKRNRTVNDRSAPKIH